MSVGPLKSCIGLCTCSGLFGLIEELSGLLPSLPPPGVGICVAAVWSDGIGSELAQCA